MRTTEELRNLYSGQTAWIVGKGPSLERLRVEHFGPGPVVAANHAILVVQELNLPNALYSMQKDGCEDRYIEGHKCGSGYMVYPKPDVTLILIRYGFSELCLTEHEQRLYVDPPEEFGFEPSEMTLRICVAIARLMGCSEIVLVCCDSFIGDLRSYEPEWKSEVSTQMDSASHYAALIPRVLSDLKDISYRVVIPE